MSDRDPSEAAAFWIGGVPGMGVSDLVRAEDAHGRRYLCRVIDVGSSDAAWPRVRVLPLTRRERLRYWWWSLRNGPGTVWE